MDEHQVDLEGAAAEEFQRRMARLAQRMPRSRRTRRAAPRDVARVLRFAALVVAGILVVKAALHAQLGTAGYASRIDTLRTGPALDRAAAAAMAPDPISQSVGTAVRRLTP